MARCLEQISDLGTKPVIMHVYIDRTSELYYAAFLSNTILTYPTQALG
jgi:hypothetical protein